MKKRLLIVTQEMNPYIMNTEIAKIARELPQYFQEQGMEIRVLMPRFGNINERRHRLHEVVRLSGINIPIEKDDYPLIIKVASLPGARIQVYFLDNDDLFKRNGDLLDENNKFCADNADRTVFFCKGVLETIKKFGWAPDIIHCHGWMTSLIPLYIKTAYKKDPIFAKSKVIYSVYENSFKEKLSAGFMKMIPINGSVKEKEIEFFKKGDNTCLNLGAINYSDAVIKGSKKIDSSVSKALVGGDEKLVLEYNNGEELLSSYYDLYKQLLQV